MADRKIISYINQELKNGRSREEIKDSLLDSGWGEREIEEAFREAQKDSEIGKPLKIASAVLIIVLLVFGIFHFNLINLGGKSKAEKAEIKIMSFSPFQSYVSNNPEANISSFAETKDSIKRKIGNFDNPCYPLLKENKYYEVKIKSYDTFKLWVDSDFEPECAIINVSNFEEFVNETDLKEINKIFNYTTFYLNQGRIIPGEFGKRPVITQKANITEIEDTCKGLCEELKNAEEIESRNSAIFNYCKKTFHFDSSMGSGTLINGVYVKGSGENSFCVDKARCFNFPQAECEIEVSTIDPKICREILCKELKNLEEDKRNSEIEKIMDKGECDLTMDPDKGIYVKTWWEKHFKNVNCSGVIGN